MLMILFLDPLIKSFVKNLMTNEFEMSMMGELNYFLGLQIKQRSDGFSSIKPSTQENPLRDLSLKMQSKQDPHDHYYKA